MVSSAVIEDFAFYRQILILCHAGGSGVIQFLQFDNGVFDVAQQHICHVAAESLADNDTHYYVIFQYGRQCILIEGKNEHLTNIRQARKFGISVIHQELSVIDDLRVYENVFSEPGRCGAEACRSL